jgi:GxxExxY protein
MKTEVHKDEGYKLMGAAFEVYNEQGYGMAEEIYQESLEIELELRGIPFRSKQELACFYKGRELKKRYVPDLFVFNCLVVELKSGQPATSRARGTTHQLPADYQTAGRLPYQLRPQGHSGMEAIHFVRTDSRGKH